MFLKVFNWKCQSIFIHCYNIIVGTVQKVSIQFDTLCNRISCKDSNERRGEISQIIQAPVLQGILSIHVFVNKRKDGKYRVLRYSKQILLFCFIS